MPGVRRRERLTSNSLQIYSVTPLEETCVVAKLHQSSVLQCVKLRDVSPSPLHLRPVSQTL